MLHNTLNLNYSSYASLKNDHSKSPLCPHQSKQEQSDWSLDNGQYYWYGDDKNNRHLDLHKHIRCRPRCWTRMHSKNAWKHSGYLADNDFVRISNKTNYGSCLKVFSNNLRTYRNLGKSLEPGISNTNRLMHSQLRAMECSTPLHLLLLLSASTQVKWDYPRLSSSFTHYLNHV